MNLTRRIWGITVDQWVLLKIIEENNGSSQYELAQKSYRDAASITRTLNLLEKKQFIERKSIPENKRQYEIWLTTTGQDFINEHMEMINRHRQKSLDGFSVQEIDTLKNMLLRIKENVERG